MARGIYHREPETMEPTPNALSNGDFAARFAAMAAQPQTGPGVPSLVRTVLGMDSDGRRPAQTARDDVRLFDDRLVREAAKGDESIIGYVSGYREKVQKIVDLMQADERNFAEAERMYKDLQRVASESQDSLAGVISYGNLGGQFAEYLSESARSLKSGGFSTAEVSVSGQTHTLGELFGEQGYVANRMNQYKAFGYDQTVAEAYLGEDAAKSAAVGVFLRPGISKGGTNGDPRRAYNIGLLNKAARYVADDANYRRMVSAFGESGVEELSRDVLARFGDIGGMTEVLDGVTAYAEAVSAGSGDPQKSGLRAARGFMDSVNAATEAMFSDPETGRVPESLPASERRWALLSALAALGAAKDRNGKAYDFGQPGVRAAAVNAATAANLARFAGYNLFEEAKAAGSNPLDEYKRYFGYFMDNAELTPDTFVSRELTDRRTVQSVLSVTPPAATRNPGRSGASGYYNGDPSRASGLVLSSDAAGILNNDVVNAVMRATASNRLKPGGGVGSALQDMLADRDGRRRVMDEVTGAMSRSLYGSAGATLAAKVLFPWFEHSLVSTVPAPFEMSKILEDIALSKDGSRYLRNPFDPERPLRLSDTERSAVVDAARRWHLANVSDTGRYARYMQPLVAHFMAPKSEHGFGMKEDQAVRQAGVVAQQLADAEATVGSDAVDRIVAGILDRGVVYGFARRQAFKNGKPLFEADGETPVMVGGRRGENPYVYANGEKDDFTIQEMVGTGVDRLRNDPKALPERNAQLELSRMYRMQQDDLRKRRMKPEE